MDDKGEIHNITEEEAKKLFEGQPIEPFINDPSSIPR